jgi:tetratricopeptide (TPR) repeat protein
LAACRSSAPPVERIAFLTLENLTGESSLDWMRRAVPAIVSAQLTGAGRIVPLRAETVRDAYNGKATHFVHGYFERRGGKLRFTFLEEDAASHKMTRTLTVDGDALAASDRLAKQLDAAAHAFSTTNAEAVAAWGQLDFERAVALDPDFCAAWLAWVQQEIAANRPEQALTIADRALARPQWRSPIDRAQAALAAASLRNDASARAQALTELVRLVPNDVVSIRALAEQEMNARHFTESAQLFREALRIDPSDPFMRNLLGYALFYTGDLAGARREFEEYAKASGHEANALDSQGEVLFMAGQFQEAEKYFLQAHAKGPDLLGGLDLSKAAYARWLGGDLAGADEIFEKFLRYRGEHGDLSVVWRRAVWEYATGRQAQAISRLMAVTGPVSGLAQRQIEVWNRPDSLPADLAGLEQVYLRTPPSADGLVRTLYARALVASGRPEDARKILALWPLPETGEPLMQGFMFPLYRELRQAGGSQK